MAELSAETTAIIDRLKAEGDLVRNTGTNSLRQMNMKLDKFDSLFQSINTNVIEQTTLMQKQMGLAVEAAEAASTREQFEEVSSPITPEPTEKPDNSGETNKKIDAIGDSIASGFNKAFTLKNLALGGAGAFVGYNFLKGFIDKKYNGAFTEMEEGIGALGPKLKTFGESGFEDIKSTMTNIEKKYQDFAGPDGQLQQMNENLAEMNDKLRRILDFGWSDLFLSISAVGAGLATWRVGMNRINKLQNLVIDDFEKKTNARTMTGANKFQKALGIGRKIDGPPGTPQAQRVGSGSPSAGTGGAASSTTGTSNQAQRVGTGSPSAGVTSSTTTMTTSSGTQVSKSDVRTAASNIKGNQFSLDAKGRLRGPNGTFASDKEALAALEKGLSNTQYSNVFRRLTQLFKAVKIVAAVYLMYEIYVILEDDKTYPTQDSKIKAMAPLIGSIVGGLGGAAIGAAMGSIPPFTGWGTLIGGVLGGLLGGFAGNYFGEVIAKWAFQQEPANKDREDVSQMQVRKRPTGQSKKAWNKAYGKTHNPDGTPMMVGPVQPEGTGNNTNGNITPSSSTSLNNGMGPLNQETISELESSGVLTKPGGSASVGELLGLKPMSFAGASAQKQLKLDIAANGSGGPSINVVNTPTYSSSPVVVQNGGSDVTQISVGGGGSGGNGKSTTTYGTTGAIN